jgi:hypothetical protein
MSHASGYAEETVWWAQRALKACPEPDGNAPLRPLDRRASRWPDKRRTAVPVLYQLTPRFTICSGRKRRISPRFLELGSYQSEALLLLKTEVFLREAAGAAEGSIREMSGYGMAACGAKRSFVLPESVASPWYLCELPN